MEAIHPASANVNDPRNLVQLPKPGNDHWSILFTKLWTLLGFEPFSPTMSPFSSRVPSRIPRCVSFLYLLNFLQSVAVPRSFLIFYDLDILVRTGRLCYTVFFHDSIVVMHFLVRILQK